jgi:hypothetical protein
MTRATWAGIFVSIFAVAVRLIAINQPYTDTWSWRQSDVAAIAQNYFRGAFHFAHPQIDWAGNEPGYVGTEFPILPFLAAISYKIFGVHEWVGRIQAVIFFAVSLPFFFLLVRKILGEVAAAWALFFYSFAPLEIMASRCFIPDMPSLALSIIGLYFFHAWIETGRSRSFVAAAVTISLSILIKLPSAIIGAPLACIAFRHFRFRAFRNLKLWLFGVIAILPAALWYWHSYRISQQFYPHHFFGAGGIKIMSPVWYLNIVEKIVIFEFTFVVCILGFAGALFTEAPSRARPFYWWLGAMVLFIIVVGYGNRHPWYRVPLVPIAAFFASAGCEFITAKISNRAANITASILLVMLFGFSALVCARGFYRPTGEPLRLAGLELRRMTPKNSLIVAADNGDPTVFYYAERKGWHFLERNGIYYGDPDGGRPAIVDLEQLRSKGAGYVVFTSNTAWWLDLYPELKQHLEAMSALLEATSQFKIYRLNPKSE